MSSRGVNALAARVAHAAVEGTAFVWTKDGFRAFLLVQCLALAWALGPRKTIALGMQCSLACSAAKFCVVLAGSGSAVSSASRLWQRLQGPHAACLTKMSIQANKEHKLDSIWDFDPPGNMGESGAWKVLKELAATMSGGKETHDELEGLDPLPFHELVMRLILLYQHIQENPVSDSLADADLLEPVQPQTVEDLCKYLYYADQSYDCGTEANLKEALAEEGYELNFAKLEATWAEHCPAYFVATHSEAKELLITVRGTAQIEDVITDLTALPTEFGEGPHLVHGGIHASALFLKDRLLSLSKAMHEAGFRITVVGHSLGAGAAVLLAMMFREQGLERVSCRAFATPNCVDVDLSSGCAEFVTSVVYRDDIVTRFSPEALAGLHRQLLEFDLQAGLQKAKESEDMHFRFLSYIGSKMSLGPGSSGKAEAGYTSSAGASEQEQQDGKAEEEKKKSYRPHIPGRVLYIYRKNSSLSEAGSSEEHELAFVKSTCPALRCIRLSDKVVTDHLIDSYFTGFGRQNPSKVRAARKKREAQQRDEQPCEAADSESKPETGNEKDARLQQSANERDKEAKDRWRPWKAKLGLIS